LLFVILVTVSTSNNRVRVHRSNRKDPNTRPWPRFPPPERFKKDETVCPLAGQNVDVRSTPSEYAPVLFTVLSGYTEESLTITDDLQWDTYPYAWVQVSGRGETGYAFEVDLKRCPPGDNDYTVIGPCGTFAQHNLYHNSRSSVTDAAMAIYNQRSNLQYSEGSDRWSGISGHVCPPAVPPSSDSSSAITWAFWTVFGNGPDFLNGQEWTRGDIATLLAHGRVVEQALPGDLVFYGTDPGSIALVGICVDDDKVIIQTSPELLYVNKDSRGDIQSIRNYWP